MSYSIMHFNIFIPLLLRVTVVPIFLSDERACAVVSQNQVSSRYLRSSVPSNLPSLSTPMPSGSPWQAPTIASTTAMTDTMTSSSPPPPSAAPSLASSYHTGNSKARFHGYTSILRWSLVVPVISLSVAAMAVRRTARRCVCCVDDVPYEIAVPTIAPSHSSGGDTVTTIELTPMHLAKRSDDECNGSVVDRVKGGNRDQSSDWCSSRYVIMDDMEFSLSRALSVV